MSKKYKHGGGNDDYSDAFIDSTINTAPRLGASEREMKYQEKKDSKIKLMSETERKSWSEDIYSDERPDKKVGCSCGSAAVFIFSFILLLIGLGIIVFGIVQKQKKLIPLCPKCDSVINGLYIAGACVIFVSLFGFAAAKLRHKAMALPFTFFLIILSLGFFGVGIAAVVYETGLKSFNLEPLWDDAAANDHDFICSVQSNLKCSGFSHCCYTNTSAIPLANNTAAAEEGTPAYYEILSAVLDGSDDKQANNGTAYCYISDYNGTKPEWASKQCVDHCDSNHYTETCNTALKDEIKKHILTLIAVVFPTAVVLVIMAVVSVKMTRLKDKYDY